jgi:DNA-binding MarR family transcriptional regulator
VAILEMTSLSQFHRDRILWILANSDGKLERSRLRKRMAMKYADLDPILKKMEKEGKITVYENNHGSIISLKAR